MAGAETADLDVREGVDRETVETVASMGSYKYGWDTDIEMEYAPKGLNEDIVRLISQRNDEPEWMTEWRLAAFRRWQGMTEPHALPLAEAAAVAGLARMVRASLP